MTEIDSETMDLYSKPVPAKLNRLSSLIEEPDTESFDSVLSSCWRTRFSKEPIYEFLCDFVIFSQFRKPKQIAIFCAHSREVDDIFNYLKRCIKKVFGESSIYEGDVKPNENIFHAPLVIIFHDSKKQSGKISIWLSTDHYIHKFSRGLFSEEIYCTSSITKDSILYQQYILPILQIPTIPVIILRKSLESLDMKSHYLERLCY